MATNFTNKSVTAGTTFTDVYTCPGNAKAVVFGMSISNINSGGNSITVEVRVEDVSASEFPHTISPGTPIDSGSTLIAAGGVQKIVLEEGDKLQVSCSDADSADVFVSVLEIS